MNKLLKGNLRYVLSWYEKFFIDFLRKKLLRDKIDVHIFYYSYKIARYREILVDSIKLYTAKLLFNIII